MNQNSKFTFSVVVFCDCQAVRAWYINREECQTFGTSAVGSQHVTVQQVFNIAERKTQTGNQKNKIKIRSRPPFDTSPNNTSNLTRVCFKNVVDIYQLLDKDLRQ